MPINQDIFLKGRLITNISNDEKILLRKTKDLVSKSEKTFSVVYSHFLTPAQQMFLLNYDEFAGVLSFEGGYEDAERSICRICTNEYNSDDGLPIILYSVRATDKNAVLSHRDVLGALMGLGIKREMIGDIMTNQNKAQFFCHDSVSGFVEMNLTKIGRYSVEINKSDFSEIIPPPKKPVNINVSSMRLDSVCGECFGVSRTKAAEIIRRGLVSVNWQITDSISCEVKAGDRISMRGKGKIRLGEVTGQSKKGRLFVTVYRYV